MWILGADADEAAGKAAIEAISALVTQNGGEMVDAESWGRRTLSYPIKKSKEGTYFLAHFKLALSAVPEFERGLNLNQDVIRYLLLAQDTKKAARRAESRSRTAPQHSQPSAPAVAAS
ncbi:MAG: 30S ribosomal protein S6 [Chloroflexi bacterium]|nr:30S ribosomal protein S6 [Chloroflexota bacterium]